MGVGGEANGGAGVGRIGVEMMLVRVLVRVVRGVARGVDRRGSVAGRVRGGFERSLARDAAMASLALGAGTGICNRC
jgi:hypothetical protein